MRHGLLLTLTAGALGWACACGAAELADAVMRGDAAATDRLLAAHADVNEPRPDGGTALHWAVYRNDVPTARKLLKAGANVSAANEAGVAPLLLAAERGVFAGHLGIPVLVAYRIVADARAIA